MNVNRTLYFNMGNLGLFFFNFVLMAGFEPGPLLFEARAFPTVPHPLSEPFNFTLHTHTLQPCFI